MMMVVTAGGEEGRLPAELCHQREPEHIAIEGDGLRDRRHLQMDVTHPRPVREAVERLCRRVVDFPEQAVDVERHGREARRDLSLPHLARPVPVDLDPVPVGVAQIERLADEVVGQPDERHAVADRMREPAREVDPPRDEEREVVEPGRAGNRSRARLLDEHE